MKKWFLIVDVAKCCNCQNCTMAMKDEYVGNDYPGYAVAQPQMGHDWITIDRHIRGSGAMLEVTYVPRMCNHCDDAPCIKAGTGAVYKRPDGIVIIDPVKAKGRKDIVSSCPYGAISWNEEAQVPQQWIFDAHLLDQGWNEPRCTQACPTGALRSMKISDDEMERLVATDKLAVINPKAKTKPRVYYRNMQRVTTRLLCGNVVTKKLNGLSENVEGAKVLLSDRTKAPRHTVVTDCFGDFRFDEIQADADSFALNISHPEHGGYTGTVKIAITDNLGSIELVPA